MTKQGMFLELDLSEDEKEMRKLEALQNELRGDGLAKSSSSSGTRDWERDATYIFLRLSEEFPDLLNEKAKLSPQKVVSFLREEFKKTKGLKACFRGS